MKLTRSLLLIFLAIIFVRFTFAQDDVRPTATWQVQKYDISATVPSADTDRSLAVKANLSIKNISSSPATTLSLRISSVAEIAAVTINGASADFTKREEKVGTSGSLQRVAIRVPATSPGGVLTATVDYKLTIKDNSGLSSIGPAGSTFLPLSYWYPTPNSWYFARGADYAPFSVKVSGANGLTVISAGVETGGVFTNTSAGQPFFLTGNWDAISSGGITVDVPKGLIGDARARADELSKLAADAKTFAAGILGTAPEMPFRIVGVHRGAGFAEDGTILVDDSVFRRSKIDSQTAMNIAEAIVKTWIGGSIAIAGDGQGVVREGLSRFIAI